MEREEKQLELLHRALPGVAGQLRSSLGNIHGAIRRLASQEAREADPQLDADAALLYQSYYRILRVVNNLDDADCLLEDGLLPVENGDIVGFCREVCHRAEDPARMCRLALHFASEKSSHIIAFNSDYMERLMLNLLSNAFKFTPAGGSVTMSLKVQGDVVTVTVSDTGVGISEEMQSTLFDRYLHTGRMDTAAHGLGLGLPICRRIAAGHGGSIMALSRVGEGTRMIVSLPNRRSDVVRVKDLDFDYAGGFNHTLLELADALPAAAFTHLHLD